MSNKKKELIMSIKFVGFSVSAGVIQVLADALMNEVIGTKPWVSYLVALVLSVVWNFTLNRKFTFHSAANIPVAMLKVALYYIIFTPVSTWWTKVLTENLLWNEYLVLALTMIINFVTEYLYQRFFVFKNSIDSAVKEDK